MLIFVSNELHLGQTSLFLFIKVLISEQHAMKAYKRNRGEALLLLTSL
jgi:hypothetical protein